MRLAQIRSMPFAWRRELPGKAHNAGIGLCGAVILALKNRIRFFFLLTKIELNSIYRPGG